jgi:septation ring formation regulator EzrA
MRERLEKQEAKRREAEESYSSLQNEVDVKTKKMSKLWNKLQETQQEIKAMHDDFVDARNGVQVCRKAGLPPHLHFRCVTAHNAPVSRQGLDRGGPEGRTAQTEDY